MNRNYDFEAMLALAVGNDMREELALFDEIDDSDVVFEPKFERKMRKLLSKKYTPLSVTIVFRRVAVVCMIILSSLFILGMTSAPVREAFGEFIASFYDKYVSIESKNSIYDDIEKPLSIEVKCEPTYGIDGYDKNVIADSPIKYMIYYEDQGIPILTYTQKVYTESLINNIGNVNCSIIETTVNGNYALFCNQQDSGLDNSLIWSDEYTYILEGCFSEQELILIAESIK